MQRKETGGLLCIRKPKQATPDCVCPTPTVLHCYGRAERGRTITADTPWMLRPWSLICFFSFLVILNNWKKTVPKQKAMKMLPGRLNLNNPNEQGLFYGSHLCAFILPSSENSIQRINIWWPEKLQQWYKQSTSKEKVQLCHWLW